jgi:hypothetical protein
MAKSLRDLLLDVSRALPAQNTNANSTAIDLKQVAPDTLPEHFEFQVSVPATTTATNQTITITIQDSADNSTFATVEQLEPLLLTGASNATALTTRNFRLPSDVNRYVRVNIAMSATTGDQTAITAGIRLVF